MKFMLVSVFPDYGCSNSTCNLPFVNGTPVPMLNYEETIDVCEAAIRRNVKQAFKLALELEKGWTTHEE